MKGLYFIDSDGGLWHMDGKGDRQKLNVDTFDKPDAESNRRRLTLDELENTGEIDEQVMEKLRKEVAAEGKK